MYTQTNDRLNYLDAARAFALILGIIFHASLSFMPMFIGWAVMDISTSSFVTDFVLISHSFRMELFFLIAGFFSHMSFHQKGLPAFLQSRFKQIAIPFIVGWFLLRPLLVSGWIIGAESKQGEANVLQAIITGFSALASLPNDLFVGTHLWFLYYLLLLTLMLLSFRYLICANKPIRQYLMKVFDNVVAWLCNGQFTILILAAPTGVCLWYMNHWGVDTPDRSLVPNISVLIVYGGFFLFGWLLHRQPALLEKLSDLSRVKFIVCTCAIATTLWLSPHEMLPGHSLYLIFKAAFALSYAIMMWSIISLVLGACKHLFNQSNKVIRYLANTSYWMYLIHLPIVVWLQSAFAELPTNWLVKLIVISTITIGFSLALYEAVVRRTFIGALLNGKRVTNTQFGLSLGKIVPTRGTKAITKTKKID